MGVVSCGVQTPTPVVPIKTARLPVGSEESIAIEAPVTRRNWSEIAAFGPIGTEFASHFFGRSGQRDVTAATLAWSGDATRHFGDSYFVDGCGALFTRASIAPVSSMHRTLCA